MKFLQNKTRMYLLFAIVLSKFELVKAKTLFTSKSLVSVLVLTLIKKKQNDKIFKKDILKLKYFSFFFFCFYYFFI